MNKVAVLGFSIFLLVTPIATDERQSMAPVAVETESLVDMSSPQRLYLDYYRLAALQLMVEQWYRLAERGDCRNRKLLWRCIPLGNQLEKLE